MKPITDMTPAEIDAEIVSEAWGYDDIMEWHAEGHYMSAPSLSLDTCIAAMEAGGVRTETIVWALHWATNNNMTIPEIRDGFCRATLRTLREKQEPRRA